jgi:arylsulfatase A
LPYRDCRAYCHELFFLFFVRDQSGFALDETKHGMPVKYVQHEIEKAELYGLANDVSETTDVASRHPDIVKRWEAEAEKAREELGDSITRREGKGVRQPGRLVEE